MPGRPGSVAELLLRFSIGFLWVVCVVSAVSGQEVTDWLRPLSPDESTHAGLLGKRYVDGQWIRLMSSDVPPGMPDHFDGFRLHGNTPLFVADEKSPISADGFAVVQRAGFDASVPIPVIGPPFFELAAVDVSSLSAGVGVSVYAEVCRGVRPFAQLGARWYQDDVKVTAPQWGTFRDRERSTSLLCVPGVELDVISHVALRGSLDVVTDGPFDTSEALVEAIIWPHEHLYLRLGGMSLLDGSGEGIVLGAGLAF